MNETRPGAQFCGRSMKTWTQICKHFTSIFTPPSENTKTAITFFYYIKKLNLNTFFCFLNLGRALYNRAGRKTVRAGRSALRNMPSWNTAVYITRTEFVSRSRISADFTLCGLWFVRCGHCKALEPEWKKAASALRVRTTFCCI